MKHEVLITAGSQDDQRGKPLDAAIVKEAFMYAKAEMSKIFGGVTERASRGGYTFQDGRYVEEASTTLQSVMLDRTPAQVEAAKEIARYLRDRLDQESVLFTIRKLEEVDFI